MSNVYRNWLNSQKSRLERDLIDHNRYYEGFKVGRDKKMFEQEIVDAKLSYEKQKEEAEENLADVNGCLVHYMERFIEYTKKLHEANEKLERLEYKFKELKGEN